MTSTLPFTSSLIDQVRLNLIHYNLWTNVEKYESENILSGLPKEKLTNTDVDITKEWIIPRTLTDSKLSVLQINSFFKTITKLNNEVRPKRIILGIVNDDGTVVYYFVHDGITKPRQN
ncbi:SEN15 tRNA-splicing endonuclease subunit SEN15 [Candida maltosa Xu316]|uniref:tRNA-splicing endonuclease subunit Sen15 domain-containing protein n=1 Tax=Candida maltosa (strain Xu316) TaxID=1245528 RepID=M3J4F9_CANMX|nr:hypothetical protein G210_2841 [Candida maltosa Xu316]